MRRASSAFREFLQSYLHSQQLRLASSLLVLCENYNKRKKKNRGGWVREWVLRRENYGTYNNLLNELRIEDAQQFKNFIGMLAVDLEELLSKVSTRIKKQDTHLRASISPGERMVTSKRQCRGRAFGSSCESTYEAV
ncbi:hypothetical protein ILUMI_14273 [Ignelater luminosus]|uniref:Uncharacterized protein n=1 Tax=Ignelater luminosus TaxID=2038154 RepID=A0A8K0G505_IGNLU|nr:hypothetical protein ILUMI_14273 [Ignelater luminosus]